MVYLLDDEIVGQAKIREFVSKLLTTENIQPNEIIVLIGDSKRRKLFERALKEKPLYSNYSWKVGVEVALNEVRIESVAKFKGLNRRL